jgi:hypothetical protein
MYKCPLCSYKTISLNGLKMHIAKRHQIDECPVCKTRYRNLAGHFYIYARHHEDSQHLLLYYLFTRETLSSSEKKIIEKLLSEEVRG